MTLQEVREMVEGDSFKPFEDLEPDELFEKFQEAERFGVFALIPSEKIKHFVHKLLDTYAELGEEEKKEVWWSGFVESLRYLIEELSVTELIDLVRRYKDIDDNSNMLSDELFRRVNSLSHDYREKATIYWIVQNEKDLVDVIKKLPPNALLDAALGTEDTKVRDDILKAASDLDQHFYFDIRSRYLDDRLDEKLRKLLQTLHELSTKGFLDGKVAIDFREGWMQSLSADDRKELLAEIERLFGRQMVSDPIADCIKVYEDSSKHLKYALGKVIGNFYGANNLIRKVYQTTFRTQWTRRHQLVRIGISEFLSPSYSHSTNHFMAGFYSTAPFSKLKRRINDHLLSEDPLLVCNLVAAGAPMPARRIQAIYEKMKKREDAREHAEEYLRVAAEERVRRGFRPVELPKEVMIRTAVCRSAGKPSTSRRIL